MQLKELRTGLINGAISMADKKPKTVCMFYDLKHGGKAKDSVVEKLYNNTISIPGCDNNIKDYCENYLDCPNKGKINGNGIHLNAGSFPGECYLRMEYVNLNEDDEENEEPED